MSNSSPTEDLQYDIELARQPTWREKSGKPDPVVCHFRQLSLWSSWQIKLTRQDFTFLRQKLSSDARFVPSSSPSKLSDQSIAFFGFLWMGPSRRGRLEREKLPSTLLPDKTQRSLVLFLISWQIDFESTWLPPSKTIQNEDGTFALNLNFNFFQGWSRFVRRMWLVRAKKRFGLDSLLLVTRGILLLCLELIEERKEEKRKISPLKHHSASKE